MDDVRYHRRIIDENSRRKRDVQAIVDMYESVDMHAREVIEVQEMKTAIARFDEVIADHNRKLTGLGETYEQQHSEP